MLKRSTAIWIISGMLVLTIVPLGADAASIKRPTLLQAMVTNVDAAGGVIYLKKSKGRKRTITVTPQTGISLVDFSGARSGTLSDIKAGDRISAFVQKISSKPSYRYKGLLIVKFVTGEVQTPPQDSPGNTAPPSSPQTSASCDPLPAATGNTVTVSNASELADAVKNANKTGNVTILLKDGTYNLSNGFWVDGDSITFRGLSGDRDKVVLKGKGMNGGVSHGFWVAGSDITIADLTVGWVGNHPIQVHGELDADRVHVRNVRIVDGGEQLLKGSYDAQKMHLGADGGVVECSLFEYSAGVGPQSYIGGIDVHNGKNWIVRNNVFKAIRAPSGLAEHAIHFWSDSENTLVEGNVIINSDRGIGFGLGDRGHKGGIIRNNMIYHNSNYGDVGIGLENAKDAQVYNNTIFQEQDYPNAIEYRFEGTTGVKISNNLTNKAITKRKGASAVLENNVTDAQKGWFKDPTSGDLHLTSSAPTEMQAGADPR